jgi:hypothetical protein
LIDIFFNDLSENIIECVFYEVLGCVLQLRKNIALLWCAPLPATLSSQIAETAELTTKLLSFDLRGWHNIVDEQSEMSRWHFRIEGERNF